MSNRKATAFLVIMLVLLISSIGVNRYGLAEIKLVENDFILTYLGVFLGFAITIYTFGVSMLDSIRNNIDQKEGLSASKKARFFRKLQGGFLMLKQDIWLIFICFLIVVVLSISSYIPALSFTQGVRISSTYEIQVSKPINLSIFILSLWATFDLMRALFNVSEIQFELIIDDLEDGDE